MKISTAVDITPTWAGLLPALVELANHKDLKVRSQAWTELRRMAQAADQLNIELRTMAEHGLNPSTETRKLCSEAQS